VSRLPALIRGAALEIVCMAVVVRILSGVRRNDRIVLDSRMFRAGSDPSCEVFFDPERDTTVRGRSAKFCLQDGGWYLHCAGGEMYVNGKRVGGATHLRSGDKIRMSSAGPEFSFEIAAAVKAPPVSPPELQVVPLQSSQGEPKAAPAQPLAVADSAAAPVAAQPAPVAAPSQERRDRQPIIWFAGGLAATLLALIVFRWVVFPPQPSREEQPLVPPAPVVEAQSDTIEANVGETAENTGTYACRNGGAAEITASFGDVSQNDVDRTWYWSCKPDAPSRRKVTITARSNGVSGKCVFALVVRSAGKKDIGKDANKEGGKHIGKGIDKGVDKDPTEILCNRLRGSVFLVLVGTADDFCPMATCVALDEHTLLTTAREATGLAKFRDDKGYKMWVARPPVIPQAGDKVRFEFQAEVQEIRVPAPFVSLTETSPNYFDHNIAMLTVKDPLPAGCAVTVALADDLRNIQRDSQVVCFGFSSDCKLVSGRKKYEPQLTKGNVNWRFETGQMMRLDAELPQNMSGSPILSEGGKLIGIYGAPTTDAHRKNLHSVTILDLELLQAWLDRSPRAKIWVSPLSPPTTGNKRETP
jgi:hypothetical protein